MKNLNKSIDEKPITAAFLVAIIVGLICLIVFVLKFYEPQYELPPKLIAKSSDGQEIELVLLSYDWTYKGEEKFFNPGQDSRYLVTYDFNGENTIYNKLDFNMSNNVLELKTEPKYKVKGFTTNALRYNKDAEDYQSGNGTILGEEGKSKMSYYIDTDTNLVTVTLYSETQGMAVYGFKTINSYYVDYNKLKEIGNLELDKDSVSGLLKDLTYGRFLNDIQIENNRLILTYDYSVDSRAIQAYTNMLFAVIDNLEEVEFRFSYDKYTKSNTDPITYQTTYTDMDSIEPIIYSRNSFIDTYLNLPLEELKAFLGK